MKIFIGTPYYRTVHPDFVTCLMQMLLASSKVIQCTHLFVQGTNASRQRNILSKLAVIGGYDYLLTVDSDMTFPFDVLIKFLDANVPVIGGVYTGRIEEARKLLMVFKEDKVEEEGVFVHYNNKKEFPTNEQPFKVAGVGSGFLLIRTSVLAHMYNDVVVERYGLPFNFWEIPKKNPLGPDLSFCHRLNELNIDIWADPRPKIGHIYEDVSYPEEDDGINNVTEG